MDLSGRASGYRGVAIRCPGCAEAMSAEALAEAEVDVCQSCGGIWVDWFDGEVRQVASEVLAGETARASRPGVPSSSLRAEALATGACPRCTRQLVVERYAIPAAGSHAATPTGADLLRCEECAGVFVSRPSAALLATLPADESAPPSSHEHAAVLDALPWQKLIALLRRLLGGEMLRDRR